MWKQLPCGQDPQISDKKSVGRQGTGPARRSGDGKAGLEKSPSFGQKYPWRARLEEASLSSE
jgi:hypothetical protein